MSGTGTGTEGAAAVNASVSAVSNASLDAVGVVSLAPDLTSEWRTRPINLFSVLKSFVYQLRPGQDLTRVSLPTELCYPFSALEFMAVRLLEVFHGLFELKDTEDEKERFLVVLRWYLSLLREGEAVYTTRKPFNSVICEVHHAWIDYSDARNADVLTPALRATLGGKESDPSSWSTFVSEQVSHHPPVMAFVAENKAHGIRIDCSAAFEVKFGSNSASVNIVGPMTITTPRETFVLSQAVPNLVIKNVVWGTKYIMYEGSLYLYCVSSGFCAAINMREEEGQVNVFSGTLHRSAPGAEDEGELVHEFRGMIGREGVLTTPGSAEERKFFDRSTVRQAAMSYLPRACQSPFESMQVWREANAAIVSNDIVTADTFKKQVEAEQRVRQKKMMEAGKMTEGRYFRQQVAGAHGPSEDTPEDEHKKPGPFVLQRPLSVPTMAWHYHGSVSFDPESLKKMEEAAQAEFAELERQRAEAARLAAEAQGGEGDGSCVIS